MTLENEVEDIQKERHEFETLLGHQKKQIASQFSEELEEKFWNDRQARICKLIISAFIPASIFYLIFEIISLPINYFTTEAQFRNHDVFMTLISYTTGWVALLCIYIMAKHPIWKNNYSAIVSTVICISLTIVQSVLFLTQSLAMTWRGTLIIIFALMFAYMCSGLRPLHTFVAGIIAAVLTCIVLGLTAKHVPPWVLFNVMILGNLVGLGLAILTVSTERVRFLQSRIIELDKKLYEILNKHLTTISQQDTLTLLGNRRSFKYQMEEMIQWTQQSQSSLAVLFIDVDFFKMFNDVYGHQQGDLALIRVAQTLKRHISEDDLAIRYGGEEFVIVLVNTNLQESKQIAENILQDIRDQKIVHEKSEISAYLTLSIGMTLYKNKQMAYDEILNVADNALYESKRLGRDRLTYLEI
ncbi:GGDEF domain-containing protein [Acinetobacter sp. WCHAc060025]|uniref:GGDEF domain-containing protein n=1 Tax=Acinetobacter sp. WCHAc060025 TaxID=2518625 RepID=UPI001022AD4F|nr:GGDEF domain-containing protein [Acinetobacter sp. WCHAc060025]RZG76249.1 GGDEF domain-containing protein [Acinetobacter sp. WCHAc060025]